MAELENEFGETNIVDFTGNQLTVKIANTFDRTIGNLFGFIEKLRSDSEKYMINEYQAEQTTLEQIFNSFTRADGALRF